MDLERAPRRRISIHSRARTLLWLCGGAGVDLYRGRIAGLACINPDFTQLAVGVRGKDGARLVGVAARAWPHDIDCFHGDAQTVAGIAGVCLLDLSRGALRARGSGAANRALALDELQVIVARLTRNVGRVG